MTDKNHNMMAKYIRWLEGDNEIVLSCNHGNQCILLPPPLRHEGPFGARRGMSNKGMGWDGGNGKQGQANNWVKGNVVAQQEWKSKTRRNVSS